MNEDGIDDMGIDDMGIPDMSMADMSMDNVGRDKTRMNKAGVDKSTSQMDEEDALEVNIDEIDMSFGRHTDETGNS